MQPKATSHIYISFFPWQGVGGAAAFSSIRGSGRGRASAISQFAKWRQEASSVEQKGPCLCGVDGEKECDWFLKGQEEGRCVISPPRANMPVYQRGINTLDYTLCK